MRGRTFTRALWLLTGLLIVGVWHGGVRTAAARNDAFSREQRRLYPLARHGSNAQTSSTAARYLRWFHPQRQRSVSKARRLRRWSLTGAVAPGAPAPNVVVPNPGGSDIVLVNDPALEVEDFRTQHNPSIIQDFGDLLVAWSDPNGIAWTTSFDNGDTFEPEQVHVDSAGGIITGHPVLGAIPGDDVYMAHMWVMDNMGEMEPHIGVSTSDDFGFSFGDPVSASPDFDPLLDGIQDDPWLVVDNTGGANDASIFVSWTNLLLDGTTQIKASVSTDGAATFATPVVVGVNGEGSQVAVDNNDSVFAVWQDNGQVFTGTNLVVSRSDDGGATWGAGGVDQNRIAAVVLAGEDRICDGQPARALFGDIRLNHHPHLAVDNSGGLNDGQLYVVWNDGRNGDADIFISRSPDNGLTWSAPLRVNQDTFRNGLDQFFPAVCVDDMGQIEVIFYDRRDDPGNFAIHVYQATSSDGGLTWTERRLTPTSFLPPYISPPSDPNIPDCSFGPENQIVCNSGETYAVWTDARNSYDSGIWGTNADPNIYFSRGEPLTVDEPERVRVYVDHSFPRDVELKLGQGDPNSPDWMMQLTLRQAGAREDLFFDVDVSAFSATLPPVDAASRLFLRAQDTDPGISGRVLRFELFVPGEIFRSDDTPADIPEAVVVSPIRRQAPQPTPGEVIVFIGPQNTPPDADAGADQVVPENSLVTLDASGSSDIDLQPLTYLWKQLSGPTVTLSDVTAQQPTFTAPLVLAPVELEFRVCVSDGLETAPADTKVTVIPGALGTVKGRVVNAQNQPVAGAQVFFTRADDLAGGPFVTNAGGNYTANLRPGDTTARAEFPNLEPVAPDAPNTSGFTIVSNQILNNVDFMFSGPAATLGGTVRDANGLPLVNALVEFVDELGTVLGADATDAGGDYLIPDLDSMEIAEGSIIQVTPGGQIPRWIEGPVSLNSGQANVRDFQYGRLLVKVKSKKRVKRLARNALVEVRIGNEVIADARLPGGKSKGKIVFPQIPATAVRVIVSNPGIKAEVRDTDVPAGGTRKIRIVVREVAPL